ncbi:ethanolamine kinase isoform X2 [Drosophila gunungcola]|uniref:ethanolamine kinase isoform X2 n=1 Tax=Drosophila gunungcola TaxID=103775 RepID=UPI0022E727BC|nr:ethanolamine kinase isoform X2 [Drosophila gunungcola]
MGTETKSNSYTGQISTSGGNPKVMKDSLSLVRQTVNQHSQSNQVQNQLNSNSNSYPNESDNEHDNNSRDIQAKQEDKSRKEAIVPFVPIFVEEADVIQGAKELLKVIRPTWDLSHVEFKSFTDGITNKLVGCFHNEISKLRDENGGSYLPIKTQGLSPVQSEDPVIIEKDDEEFTDDLAADGALVQYSDNVVLVRIYGNKTDLLIDRKAETQNFLLLHTYGLAPSLYATFKNGLVYEYVPGTTLNTDSVLCPEIWPLVARRMAEMHRKVRKHGESSATKPLPMIWKKTQSFLDLVPERFSDAEKHKSERNVSTYRPPARGVQQAV